MTLLIREHSSSSYGPRTWANALEADLTIAIAADYTTAGERLTKKAATKRGDEHFLELPIHEDWIENARILFKRLTMNGSNSPKSINVAGNGIYTLAKHGYTQDAVNLYVYNILAQVEEYYPLRKIVSGGQTGTDQAGGYAGWKLGIPTVMTLPKGFIQRHEDGVDREHTMEEIWKATTGEDYNG